MNIRYVVIIEGKVQKGGFRSFIKENALMRGIKGYAENLSSSKVIVIAEGERKNVEDLLEIIEKDAPTFIEVREIHKRKEEFTGSFTDFERKGVDILQGIEGKEVKEILLDIASYSRSTDKKLEKGIVILGEIKKDTSTMLEKQDLMLEKQDNTITAVREESQITRDTISQELRKLETQIKR